MMKSIWTGAIAFGLVNIPVKLYSAAKTSALNLDMLDKEDHSRIRYRRVNEKSGKMPPDLLCLPKPPLEKANWKRLLH